MSEALALLATPGIRAVVLAAVAGGPASATDVFARVGEEVRLHAAVERIEGDGCTWVTAAPRVRGRCRVLRPPAGVAVRWFKLEAEQAAYDNVPEGRFLAASISYGSSLWVEGPWTVSPDVRPVLRKPLLRAAASRGAGAGTMRFAIALELPRGGRLLSTWPSAQPGGPLARDDARRVSLRADDSYLGVLSELGGLPYVFGSTALGREAHQAERRIGVDCADLMIYGLRRLGRDEPYRSSRTLGPASRLLRSRVIRAADGVYRDAGGAEVRVGEDGVQPGDWLIFGGHVGAFFEDQGTAGVLDEQDLMIHTAWSEVGVESLAASGYAAHPIELRRPRALDAPVPLRPVMRAAATL